MQILNFVINDDFISITKDGVYVDLHNNFDFSGYSYNVKQKEFKLIFKRVNGDWTIDEVFNEIVFKFQDVVFLKIKEASMFDFPEDESCLSMIGISTFDMRNMMDSVIDLGVIPEHFDMLFIFEQGQAIRIHAGSVLIETTRNE